MQDVDVIRRLQLGIAEANQILRQVDWMEADNTEDEMPDVALRISQQEPWIGQLRSRGAHLFYASFWPGSSVICEMGLIALKFHGLSLSFFCMPTKLLNSHIPLRTTTERDGF